MKELDTSWHSRAICRDLGDDTFFPEKSDPDGAVRAKRICTHCPVNSECHGFAEDSKQRWGIWGGEKFPLPRGVPLYLQETG